MSGTTTRKGLLSNLTFQIFIAMVAGAAVGIYLFAHFSEETCKDASTYLKLLATIFIRLVQMIIAPLVFSTLVVGIAKLGDIRSVGRIGGRALAWFFTASFLSLLIGMFWVNTLQPGAGLQIEGAGKDAVEEIAGTTESFSAQTFIEHIFPKSVVQAMATNEILQIVIFAIFFGLAAASLGSYAKPVIGVLERLSHIILKMVGYVMKFAPLGVFGAIAGVFAVLDAGTLVKTYLTYLGSFLVGIATLWVLLLAIGAIFLGKRMGELLKRITSPIAIAFGTTSSEAVFPKLTEELERFGVKERIVSFMLPLGYSFNLDGSMMYMTFASIFIAQVYHIHLDFTTQLTMLFVLMLTSKGIAGVPRASLVVVAATCGMFDIPVEGIALILPIDHFCDMFRSGTNVLGNALATSVIGKWEGEDNPNG
ncbi:MULTISPECIES: dicarboxylate/amino acid:cation symporter [unclassified Flavobacterium]|uniref:dicarboxylate/amino acid:cation symporter n=1 Tax=unclassified Flavobacterium TaxID=196869 RepID=UPI001F13417A|nr:MULTISPECIES: cation:dicarboxylase symporter family transporter [unclassified Flavobacterium]UMY64965.1 cation:dicarboxylase symporter family transporter [Flavobacterium sp. HJ-32-4]